jgi:hypothetical protein|nr:MAG TPA: hypothetical protein [Caudoviricetes sp.]
MKIDYLAFLLKDGVVIEKHIINMPAYGEKGWYKSVLSIDAFKNREAKRYYEMQCVKQVPITGLLCHVHRLAEWEQDNEASTQRMRKYAPDYIHPYNLVPVIVHDNVFDFYRHIGYDIKTKRYV